MAVKVCTRCGNREMVLVTSSQIGTSGSPCNECGGSTVIKAS